MRTVWTVGVTLFAVCTLAVGLWADDRAATKETTLKGTILCAKCGLKETKKCVTAIQVKEGDQTVTYYFDDKGNKEKYHGSVCGGETEQGTVTGIVSEKDGKKWIKPSKVDYAKN